MVLFGETLFLGEDLLPLLLLAFGGAMAVGSFGALVRPPSKAHEPGETQEGRAAQLQRAPRARTIGFGVMGLVIALWALASLVSG